MKKRRYSAIFTAVFVLCLLAGCNLEDNSSKSEPVLDSKMTGNTASLECLDLIPSLSTTIESVSNQFQLKWQRSPGNKYLVYQGNNYNGLYESIGSTFTNTYVGLPIPGLDYHFAVYRVDENIEYYPVAVSNGLPESAALFSADNIKTGSYTLIEPNGQVQIDFYPDGSCCYSAHYTDQGENWPIHFCGTYYYNETQNYLFMNIHSSRLAGVLSCFEAVKKIINYEQNPFLLQYSQYSEKVHSSDYPSVSRSSHYHIPGSMQTESVHPHRTYYTCTSCGVTIYTGNTSTSSICSICNPVHNHIFNSFGYNSAHPHQIYYKCTCGAVTYTSSYQKVNGCLTCYPPHVHNFNITGYDPAHPHKIFNKCSCGSISYTSSYQKVITCTNCYPPHTHLYNKTVQDTVHPHRISLKCSCGQLMSTSTYGTLSNCITCYPPHVHEYNIVKQDDVHPHQIRLYCSCGIPISTGSFGTDTNCPDCIQNSSSEASSAISSLQSSSSSSVGTGGITPAAEILLDDKGEYNYVDGTLQCYLSPGLYQYSGYSGGCSHIGWLVLSNPKKWVSSTCFKVEYYCNYSNCRKYLNFIYNWASPVPTSSGSASSVHTHLYNTSVQDTEHPHRIFLKCLCGELMSTGNYGTVESCLLCNPASSSSSSSAGPIRLRRPVGTVTGAGYYDANPFMNLVYFTNYVTNSINPLKITTNVTPKYHLGQDWNGNDGGDTDLGDPVYAVTNGTVSEVYPVTTGGWGRCVAILHTLGGQNYISFYGHLNSVLVSVNTPVTNGQQIGTIGKGDENQYWAHLHFEWRIGSISTSGPGYVLSPVAEGPQGQVDPALYFE